MYIKIPPKKIHIEHHHRARSQRINHINNTRMHSKHTHTYLHDIQTNNESQSAAN